MNLLIVDSSEIELIPNDSSGNRREKVAARGNVLWLYNGSDLDVEFD